ncbi:MAG TPA: zf-HC2 domain-containing protein [Steroidobacter sp.]|uniref:zf-HC2 domain-containing protein n=1 Tax=Steroidobacter sp. TaxID=1978227 RepID=UPI002ED8B16A
MTPPSIAARGQPPGDHSDWDDSLQDWLDGELNEADGAAFEAHLAQCARCQQNLSDFEALDASLSAAAPPIEPSAAFDQKLYAQIAAIDESQRSDARQRLEQEWQEQLQSLRRNWRRTLVLMIPGVIGGAVLALALLSWLDSSGVTSNLVASGADLGGVELGRQSFDYLRLALTAVVGAAFGMLLAPWLARMSE